MTFSPAVSAAFSTQGTDSPQAHREKKDTTIKTGAAGAAGVAGSFVGDAACPSRARRPNGFWNTLAFQISAAETKLSHTMHSFRLLQTKRKEKQQPLFARVLDVSRHDLHAPMACFAALLLATGRVLSVCVEVPPGWVEAVLRAPFPTQPKWVFLYKFVYF